MRAFVAYVAILVVALVAMCCTPRATPAPHATELQSFEVKKEISVEFHADTDFLDAERTEIESACDEWARVSAKRMRYSVVWDLNFASVDTLRAHVHDPAIVRVTSDDPIVHTFEQELGLDGVRVRMVGVTLNLRAPAIYLVVDRARDLRAVALHELGHVAGLPDVEAVGNIMSGRDENGKTPHDLTGSDVELCRKALLCP